MRHWYASVGFCYQYEQETPIVHRAAPEGSGVAVSCSFYQNSAAVIQAALCGRKPSKSSGAIAELVDLDSSPLQHREVEIHQRSVFFVADVSAGIDRAFRPAGEQDWQIVVPVSIPVANTTAVNPASSCRAAYLHPLSAT